jgi:hypothetical protein
MAIPIFGPVTRRVPLLDHADVVLQVLEPAEANELIRKKLVGILHTNRKIRALRVLEDVPAPCAMRRRGCGDSHNRENATNPAGVWTIERIPTSIADYFGRTVKEAA